MLSIQIDTQNLKLVIRHQFNNIKLSFFASQMKRSFPLHLLDVLRLLDTLCYKIDSLKSYFNRCVIQEIFWWLMEFFVGKMIHASIFCSSCVVNHSSYLNFLRLVFNHGLLIFQSPLQLFVPLQKGFSQFRRQLKICKKKKKSSESVNGIKDKGQNHKTSPRICRVMPLLCCDLP